MFTFFISPESVTAKLFSKIHHTLCRHKPLSATDESVSKHTGINRRIKWCQDSMKKDKRYAESLPA